MSSFFDDAAQGASNMWNTVSDTAGSAWNTVSDGAAGLWDDAKKFREEVSYKGGKGTTDQIADPIADQGGSSPAAAHSYNPNIPESTPERRAQDAADLAHWRETQAKEKAEYEQRFPKMDADWLAKRAACNTEEERRKLPARPELPNMRFQPTS